MAGSTTRTSSPTGAGGAGGKAHSHAGLIAGIVVAGVVALALFAILAITLIRRRSANRRAPSSFIDKRALQSATTFKGEKVAYDYSGSTGLTFPVPSATPIKFYVRERFFFRGRAAVTDACYWL